MKIIRSMLFTPLLLLSMIVLLPSPGHRALAQETRLYTPPTADQLQMAEQMFRLLFSRDSMETARQSAGILGFSWRQDNTGISLLDTHKSGWGEYHFSKNDNGSIAIQAPHRYHDKDTGTIAMRLYSGGGVASVALNSVSRRTPVAHAKGLSADLAHLPASLLTVYSRAFATEFPRGKLLQLHGFSSAKRLSAPGKAADFILSTGSAWSSAWLLDTQSCLIDAHWNALRYPHQVRELGGTTNRIGLLLRNMGHGGFAHLEMNLEVREALATRADSFASFKNCVVETPQ